MNNWISCDERLPENDEYVLTYSKDHHPNMQVGFYSTFSYSWCNLSTPFPTHWMPLPSAPDEPE